jgi:hypothetical protein
MRWSEAVRFLSGAKDFTLLHFVQTGSKAHPASYSLGTEDFFTGVKLPGHETEHSPPSSAVIKNGGAIPPLSYTHS